ncbi:MAG: MFS transporter [Gemmatimonadetes bacterium]|nr:MFS transporter [Gemmatimonadota bacterium]NIQ52739.1 MFS transporter [Gemmatimonadota bacterium]NIU72879.1 MFS transporter [Gammaproteobacteria bacterium]NIX43240.1 MFS transporter [Gemmatimonadota bacterium]NIY07414.1 MFS transporter [Gemmatimonadota bacterium]
MSTHRHRPVFAAACMGMLVFGIVLTALGSVLPSVIARFGLARADAGLLFTLLSAGVLLGSLVFGPVVDRQGYKGLLMASVAMVALGLEGIAFAPSVTLLAGSALLIGLGGGMVNGGTNALVADISAGGRSAGLSLLGVFFGIGAFGVPFVLGLLLDRLGYTAVVAGIGGLVAIPVAFYAALRFPAPKQPRGVPLRRMLAMVRDPVLLLLGLILFFESGMEITVGGWTATYFHDELAVAPDRALYYLSLYWLGMTGARLVLGWLLNRASSARVLLASMGVALVGALVLVGSSAPPAAGVGVLLTGAGFAAVFPVILGYVGDRYAELSGTAFSFVLVMALAGGSTLPWVTGVLGGAFGLRPSLLIIPAGLCAAAGVFLAVRRRLPAAPAAT